MVTSPFSSMLDRKIPPTIATFRTLSTMGRCIHSWERGVTTDHTSIDGGSLSGDSNGLLGTKCWRDFAFSIIIVIIKVEKMESVRHRAAITFLRGNMFFPGFDLRRLPKRLAALVDIPVNFAALVLAANGYY